MEDLFAMGRAATTPLAERMRPRTLDEVVSQAQILGSDRPFRRQLERGEPTSVIFWGPPGCGKTTLARLVAIHADLPFVARSAVTTGMPEVRDIMKRAQQSGQRVVLFLDEIHRFNTAQQDALLPFVEEGTVVLLGATTENPGFAVNSALLSRSRVERLEPLSDAGVGELLHRALADEERGLGRERLELSAAALQRICDLAAGDARRALGLLEGAASLLAGQTSEGTRRIERQHVDRTVGSRVVDHDRGGDSHYDLASALQKSVRGSDPDAALYYMARLLEGGEPVEFVSRRLVVCAAEDIGNADPQALVLAMAAQQAASFLGMPEARIPLAQLVIYLATSPKSNSAIVAYEKAAREIKEGRQHPVPPWLRQAPTAASRAAGHGQGYVYAHDAPNRYVPVSYLPEAISGERYYVPVELGHERDIKKRLDYWAKLRAEHGQPPKGRPSGDA